MSYVRRYLLLNEPGRKVVLPGNYAIARGALEADVDVVSGYPGTPSSEVLEILNEVSEETGIYAEISTNEIVAAEVAGGAALAGLKALVTMKHVGANVASDFFNTVNLAGIDGSFVIYIADDPGAWVSQNEQDTRIYCELFHMPCLEPYSQETARILTVKAFQLSAKYKVPVILRTTHRIAHASGVVTLGPLPSYPKSLPSGKFVKNIERWYLGDIFVQRLHRDLHEKLEKIKEEFTGFETHYIEKGSSEFAIIGDGVSIMYAKEAISSMGLDGEVSLLGLTTVYPIPDKLIVDFLKGVKEVLVVEEVEPYIEKYLKVISVDYGLKDLKVYGRSTRHIPMSNELSPSIVGEAIAKIRGISISSIGNERWASAVKQAEEKTPPRYLTFCPGCPHLATFYALKIALASERVNIATTPVILDIGCYGLAPFTAVQIGDASFNMGSGFGLALGLRIGLSQKSVPVVVGVVGDSTFYHAALPAIVNLKWNEGGYKGVLLLVADNRVTAMTGGQPDPSSGYRGDRKVAPALPVENITRSIGLETVVIDPYDIKNAIEELKKVVKQVKEGKNIVVVSRRGCALYYEPRKRPYYIDPAKCRGCRLCVNTFGCQAIRWDENINKARIAYELCVGCDVCAAICPFNAISPKE